MQFIYPYLCNSDLEDLEEIVTSKAAGGKHMDAEDLITEAVRLKRNRNLNAMNFLKRLNCLILAKKYMNDFIKRPSRAWVNTTLEKISCSLKNRKSIDENKLLCCKSDVISHFFATYHAILEKIPPFLLFNADETMIFFFNRKKNHCPARYSSGY